MEEAAEELCDSFTVNETVEDQPVTVESNTGGYDEGSESTDEEDGSEEDEGEEGGDGICDVSASFDGTWQRRGYASLNGVVSAISNDTGRCLAYECLTKNCKACEMWKGSKGSEEYVEFKKDPKEGRMHWSRSENELVRGFVNLKKNMGRRN
jgi:hypothetical protein